MITLHYPAPPLRPSEWQPCQIGAAKMRRTSFGENDSRLTPARTRSRSRSIVRSIGATSNLQREPQRGAGRAGRGCGFTVAELRRILRSG